MGPGVTKCDVIERDTDINNSKSLSMRLFPVYSLKIVLFLFSTIVIAQDGDDPSFNVENEFDKIVKVPDSPEAFAFKNFGNTEVDMYRGMPNISIPLYTVSGKDISMPITLGYNPLDLKVESRASRTGKGWNLNLGGRITRRVMGSTDDYSLGDISTPYNDQLTKQSYDDLMNWHSNGFDSELDVAFYVDILKSLRNNEVDFSPDIYSLSGLGMSVDIVIDHNDLAIPLNERNIKIEFQRGTLGSILSWKVTKNGVEYHFNLAEETYYYDFDGAATGTGGYQAKYNSSWVLTKIESLTTKDIIEIGYSTNSWVQPKPLSANTKANKAVYNALGDLVSWADLGESFAYKYYRIDEYYPSRVDYNGETIVTLSFGDRLDLSDSRRLVELEVVDDSQINSIKKIEFEYDYFGLSVGQSPASVRPEDIQLKLESVSFSNPRQGTSEKQTYAFEYYEPENVPARDSKSQDMFGFYNGHSNQTLIPSCTLGDDFFSGANRDFVFDKAITGILTKVEYPTGGHTLFEYEQASKLIYSTTPIPFSLTVSAGEGRVVHEDNLGIFDLECLNFSGCTSEDIGDNLYSLPEHQTVSFSVYNTGDYEVNVNFYGGVPNSNSHIMATLLKNDDINNISPTEIVDIIQGHIGNETIYRFNPDSPEPLPVLRQLDPGRYHVIILNRLPYQVDLSVTEIVPSQVDPYVVGTHYYPTYRLKATSDFTDLGMLAYQKEYAYLGPTQNTIPQKYYLGGQLKFEDGQVREYPTLHQLASAASGDEPIVSYDEVHEITVSNLDDTENFKKVYRFYNTGNKGSITNSSSYGTHTNYFTNPQKGQLSSEASYNDQDEKLVESANDMVSESFDGFVGATSRNSWNNRYKIPILIQGTSGSYQISYIDMEMDMLMSDFIGSSPPVAAIPDGCFNGTYNCVYFDPTLDVKLTLITSRISQMSGQTQTSYLDGGEISQITDNTYNEDFLLASTKLVASNGDEVITNYTYPLDLTNPTAAEQKLINQLRVYTPIEVETVLQKASGQVQENQKVYTVYKDWGNDVVLPERLKTAKANDTYEDRIIYYDYDISNGNPVEIGKADDVHTVYIWGYHQVQPIAKIENATYSQVASQVPNLQSLALLDNDRTEGFTGNEGALRQALNDLRASLPDAMVTTYTYDPLIGVTSITDPQGDTTYFHYDDFHRLEYVKDKDGNILSKNEYNFKLQN